MEELELRADDSELPSFIEAWTALNSVDRQPLAFRHQLVEATKLNPTTFQMQNYEYPITSEKSRNWVSERVHYNFEKPGPAISGDCICCLGI
jgi:hypothetical protein